MKIVLKYPLLCIGFVLLLWPGLLQSQSYDLQFVLVNDDGTAGGNYDIKIQIKASSSPFNLGTSNLTFSFNTAAVQNPTLLTAHNFSGGTYATLTVTEPLSGVTSVNVVLNSQETGTNIGTTYMDVATIRYQIQNPDEGNTFTWRTTAPNRTTVWNDAATPQEQAAGTLTHYSVTVADVKIFLEGPYSNGSMSTALRDGGYLPTSQPYSGAPWNYSGTESVGAVPAGVVDWVLVELRSGTAAATKVATRAGFLMNDGSVTDLDGSGPLKFEGVSPGNYYLVLKHRNHLAVMSAAAFTLGTNSAEYNFTTGADKYYGTGGAEELEANVWGMIAGDGNSDGGVYAEDYTLYKTNQGVEGYQMADYNMDSGVYAEDYTIYKLNQGKETTVP